MGEGVARKPENGSRDVRTQSNDLRTQCSGCDWGAIRVDRYIRHSPKLTHREPMKITGFSSAHRALQR